MSAASLSSPAEPLATAAVAKPIAWPAVIHLANRSAIPAVCTIVAGGALVLSAVSLWMNAVDDAIEPAIVTLLVAELFLLAHARYWTRLIDPSLVIMIGATLLAAAIQGGAPEYFAASGQSAIFHRSALGAAVLALLGVPCLCLSLFHLVGGGPRALDVSRYPVVLLPALSAVVLYGGLLTIVLAQGVPQLSWDIVVRQMQPAAMAVQVQPGFASHIQGTLLLIGLTAVIAIPIGTATGLYLNEYADPRLGRLVRFCTTVLRGVSVLVIGLTAVSLLQMSEGTPLAGVFEGAYQDPAGQRVAAGGSFVLAAIVIALLVVPTVARAAEEGCRSLPAGLREGSAALGAGDAYTLRRIIFPWAVPNIITSVLLGSAEAAGSLAPLFFIAMSGEHGVGLTRPVTSLSYAIFAATRSGSASFNVALEPHRYGAGVLLLAIALVLTGGGLSLKRRYANRYRS